MRLRHWLVHLVSPRRCAPQHGAAQLPEDRYLLNACVKIALYHVNEEPSVFSVVNSLINSSGRYQSLGLIGCMLHEYDLSDSTSTAWVDGEYEGIQGGLWPTNECTERINGFTECKCENIHRYYKHSPSAYSSTRYMKHHFKLTVVDNTDTNVCSHSPGSPSLHDSPRRARDTGMARG
jgi:hypothetical protein